MGTFFSVYQLQRGTQRDKVAVATTTVSSNVHEEPTTEAVILAAAQKKRRGRSPKVQVGAARDATIFSMTKTQVDNESTIEDGLLAPTVQKRKRGRLAKVRVERAAETVTEPTTAEISEDKQHEESFPGTNKGDKQLIHSRATRQRGDHVAGFYRT
jgi:hypothetical protein